MLFFSSITLVSFSTFFTAVLITMTFNVIELGLVFNFATNSTPFYCSVFPFWLDTFLFPILYRLQINILCLFWSIVTSKIESFSINADVHTKAISIFRNASAK